MTDHKSHLPQGAGISRDWVNCPICGEPDMRKETDSEGRSLIFCVNHGCPSNGAPAAPSAQSLEALLREYVRDLRRNSSGGDDYPWEWAKATADYLDILIDRAKFTPAAGASMAVTDAMCAAAINADAADRIQGFSYQKRHVIRDVWRAREDQEIWSAPVAGPDEYQAFQRQCRIENMRVVLTAALTAARSPAASEQELALAIYHADTRNKGFEPDFDSPAFFDDCLTPARAILAKFDVRRRQP